MIEIRPTILEDAPLLTEWLSDPDILRWFPMNNQREIQDAVHIWMGFVKYGSSLTALYEGKPRGMALLYLQPYKKFAHQCLFSIIVDAPFRGKGIGKRLLEGLEKIGKEKFQLELLHLEVYEGNPAKRLYERMGFQEYGVQKHFIREKPGSHRGKIFMQKSLA